MLLKINATGPMTSGQIDFWNLHISTNYPSAIRLAEPTWAFNCHGYAFAMRQGYVGWLDYPDPYYSDGSFTWLSCGYSNPQVSTIDYLRSYSSVNVRFGYSPDDHAARFSYSPDHGNRHLVSKWAEKGMYRYDFFDHLYYKWWEAYYR